MSILRNIGETTIYNNTSGFSNELMKKILKFDKVYSIHFFEDEFRPINMFFEEQIVIPAIMQFDTKIEKYMGANVYFDINPSLRDSIEIQHLISSINSISYSKGLRDYDKNRENFGIIKGEKGINNFVY